ncbi:unnamed protein product, partial [Brassica oleracea]
QGISSPKKKVDYFFLVGVVVGVISGWWFCTLASDSGKRRRWRSGCDGSEV